MEHVILIQMQLLHVMTVACFLIAPVIVEDAFIGSCDVCVGGETGLNELDLDLDLDGICNSDDICPEDYNNDIDDGICGNIDECPIDVNNDSDGDGSCDSDDIALVKMTF